MLVFNWRSVLLDDQMTNGGQKRQKYISLKKTKCYSSHYFVHVQYCRLDMVAVQELRQKFPAGMFGIQTILTTEMSAVWIIM